MESIDPILAEYYCEIAWAYTRITGFCDSGATVTHQVTVVSGVEYTLELSGLSADLDLFLYTSSGTSNYTLRLTQS